MDIGSDGAEDTAREREAVTSVLDVLDATAVRRWIAVVVVVLDEHRGEIDGLNVFPVADRDTVTNMALTLHAARDALDADPFADTAGAALATLASGAALGAVGNSGAIVSQVLRGLAESTSAGVPCDGVVLTAGLVRGAALARAAVVDPVEGTILTVAAAAAQAAAAGGNLGEVVIASVDAAVSALRETTEQLAVLADSGVVDAGGRGLVLLLDALAQVVLGRSLVIDEAVAPPAAEGPGECAVHDSSFAFEVQYLLDADDDAVAGLRARLSALGDSVVVAGTGGGTWNVHIHVNDVGAAIEAGIEIGKPRRVSVVRFTDQLAHARPSGVVVLAAHPGDAALFDAEGVQVLTGPVSPEVVAAAIGGLDVRDVVLLPNDPDAVPLAEAAAALARHDGLRIVVVA